MIRKSFDGPAGFLENQAERYLDLADLVKDTLESLGGEKMKKENLFKGFNYEARLKEQGKYEEETKRRWGDTDAYKESKRRASKYSKEDWAKIMSSQDDNATDLASAFKGGFSPENPQVQAIVEKNRLFIDIYFYPCSKEMFSSLGEIYVADEGFKAFYDNIAFGLAEYYRAAN